MAELLSILLETSLAASFAILLVLSLRTPARHMFGPEVAYGLWTLPALAILAVLVPARVVPIRPAAHIVLDQVPSFAAALPVPPTGAAGLDMGLVLVTVWAAGALVAGAITGGAQLRFLRRAAAGGLGPAVVGVVAPRIVKPRDFDTRFSVEEQGLVLAHERAHLARQDARVNAIVVLIQCLIWFNPLIHLGAHLLRIDQEMACDQWVLSRFPRARPQYAAALLKAQLATRPLPLGCYWPSRTEHPLFERIAMIERNALSRSRRAAGAAAIVILAAGAAVGAWAAQPPRAVAPESAHMPPAVVGEPALPVQQEAGAELAKVCLTNACGAPLPPVGKGRAAILTAIDHGDLRAVLALNGSAEDALAALTTLPIYSAHRTSTSPHFAKDGDITVLAVRVSEGHWNYIVRDEFKDYPMRSSRVEICSLPGAELQPPCLMP